MEEYEITIVIDEDGRLEADAEGFEGEKCLEELDELLEEQAELSREIEKKPEFEAGRKESQETRSIQKNREDS
jgi:hypothetical protein